MPNLAKSLATFKKWLATHPIDGDRLHSAFGIQYQVARFCEYLHANPWPHGDPLRDAAARDGAVKAYRSYLQTFNAPAAPIDSILANLDHFFLFLGLEASPTATENPGRAAAALNRSSR
ncbi:MAG TPA: hypothetical protein VFH73_00035 [Polyangia bacterium]|jgi:hypothetical protein|nr:hypothetical protein [Polyangia bacterium]